MIKEWKEKYPLRYEMGDLIKPQFVWKSSTN